ncbi:hypothetical protein HK096_010642 [Nowakowskiella sp. JEL0078]|nr:hypothetical protein HK096_010642 [Nowakowskiella sp. JEL0078]
MQHGNANAVALRNWQVSYNNVLSFWDALWVQYSPHLAELAECITEADNTTYRCVEGRTIIQEDNLQKWTEESLQLSATPHTIIILKYGLPAQQDKSGNATDEMHYQVIEQLKKTWGSQLSSKDITWRIWVGLILELPAHQHEQAIENPPPSNVLNLFH